MPSLPPLTAELPLVEAALAYAAQGWPVFPCSPQTKAPLLGNDTDAATGQKIPRTGGLKKASTDPAQIGAWWAKWPKALIGLATGHGRLFVLDFDPRTDEATGETFTLDRLKAELEAQIGTALPESVTAITQSGGVHLWLTWPDDDGAPITNRGNLPLHVDVRGLGGYVIAPPSVMASGKAYRWLRRDGADAAPGAVAIAEAPAALVAVLRARKGEAPGGPAPASEPREGSLPIRRDHGQGGDDPVEAARRKWALAALDAAIGEAEGLVQGQRNAGISAIAVRLGAIIGAGYLRESTVRAELERVARLWPDVPKTLASIDSAIATGKASPKDMSAIGTLAGQRRVSRSGQGAGWQPFAPTDGQARDDDAPAPPEGDEGPSFQPEGGAPNQHGGAGGRLAVPPDPEKDRRCALLAQTDLGNAERFLVRYGADFRFCPELGWLRWDGRRWQLLAEEKDKIPGEVMQAVFATVRAIRNEAELVARSGFSRLPQGDKALLTLHARLVADGLLSEGEHPYEVLREGEADPDTGEVVDAGLDFLIKISAGECKLFSDSIRAHAKASEGKGRLEAIANLVKSMAQVLARSTAFDADREAINVRNGTIRLGHDGNRPVIRLDPHRREDLITKMAEVDYRPGAQCPAYDAFLARVMPDADDRRFLHQWAGLSATGDVSHHRMAFFWGKGRNGKSTWVDQIATIMGDYAMTIGFDSFLEQANKRKGSDATPDLARLPGVRLLRASEPEKGAKLAEGLIKEATGGEPITARHLNKGFFEFLPSFKLTAQGNYRPKISGTDDGIWARVRLVPWTVRIPDSEIDRQLPAKLRGEASGIFNRMMDGLLDLKMHGLIESENIIQASAKYREASDALGRFLRDCTADKAGARTRSSELLGVFNAWAKASGSAEWQPQGFAKAMEDRGYSRITSNGVWWEDIETTVDVADIEAGRFGVADPQPPSPPVGSRDGSSADDDDFVPGFD